MHRRPSHPKCKVEPSGRRRPGIDPLPVGAGTGVGEACDEEAAEQAALDDLATALRVGGDDPACAGSCRRRRLRHNGGARQEAVATGL